jgi:small subunit ribosomal protein S14
MPKTCWIIKAKRKPKFKVRQVNRCQVCGRRHGFIRYFGLREMAHKGLLPGVKKYSW